jgi:hypothetical protein
MQKRSNVGKCLADLGMSTVNPQGGFRLCRVSLEQRENAHRYKRLHELQEPEMPHCQSKKITNTESMVHTASAAVAGSSGGASTVASHFDRYRGFRGKNLKTKVG